MAKTALIIGASRGLGLGLARNYLAQGWHVIATTRGDHDALTADAGASLQVESLDVTDADQRAALKHKLGAVSLDLLFVSAGVTDDTSTHGGDEAPAEFMRLMLTNALAPMALIEMFGARVAASGAIVAMSSRLGSVGANTDGGYEVYRASKAALNTMLRSYAHRHPKRAVVAMHPGWVRTDMGGANAAVSVEDSVTGMTAVIDAHLGEPGCVFVDYQGKTIAW